MRLPNPFEYVAYCHKSPSGNSIKIVAVKDIKEGDQLFVSLKEFDKAMDGNTFVARLYRLNSKESVTDQAPVVETVKPKKLNFSLNLFEEKRH